MAFTKSFEAATTPGPGRKLAGGVAMAVDASGTVLHLEAQGVTSVDPATAAPMSVDTTFWIASCTKLLTTIAVLQCVEKGLLALDQDVSDILPEWKSPEILTGFDATGAPQLRHATQPITLRQLLTHSSGMGYPFLNPDLQRWQEWRTPPADGGPILEVYGLPLLFEPGQDWNYSCAIDWAGLMVERVHGGQRLGEYMQRHIFAPLGMTSTGFRPQAHAVIRDRLCPTTTRLPTGELVTSAPYRKQDSVDDTGGGGLYSAVPDYVKVLVSLLKNDGVLLTPATVRSMFVPQLRDNQHLRQKTSDPDSGPMCRGGVPSSAWNFGLGGIVNTEDVPGVCRKGTMSWTGLPNLFWWIDPATGVCGMYGSQLLPAGDPASLELNLEFRKEVYARTRV